jgi:hypothetical protein
VTGVFAHLGVDYVQWKAVTRTLLKSDIRLPLNTRQSSLRRIGGLVSVFVFLSIFGASAAAIVVFTRDVLLGGTIAFAYLGVMLVTSLLTQHGASLLSTADYVILGSRPVSSRTFFAIRLTNLLFHAMVLTSAMAYPVIVAYALTRGGVPAIAATVAIYTLSIAIALSVAASYGVLLQLVGAGRFQRAVGYLQVVTGLMAYGGLFVGLRLLGRPALADATLPDRWWVAVIPPAWFTSYVEIGVGYTNATTFPRAGISIALVIGLGLLLRDRLGFDYARQLAELPIRDDRREQLARTPFFASREERAVALLVLAHFRHDLRVRMGILAIVPVVIVYMIIGTGEGGFDLMALAVLLFPALLSQQFAATEAYGAAWIYHCTPASHSRLVIAVKNIAVAYFLLPFLLFMAAAFTWRTGDVIRALTHTAMLGLLSHIALQSSTIVHPWLPFAAPPDKLRGSTTLVGWMVVVISGGQAAVALLEGRVYVSRLRIVVVLAVLALITLVLNRVMIWRAQSLQR